MHLPSFSDVTPAFYYFADDVALLASVSLHCFSFVAHAPLRLHRTTNVRYRLTNTHTHTHIYKYIYISLALRRKKGRNGKGKGRRALASASFTPKKAKKKSTNAPETFPPAFSVRPLSPPPLPPAVLCFPSLLCIYIYVYSYIYIDSKSSGSTHVRKHFNTCCFRVVTHRARINAPSSGKRRRRSGCSHR